MKNKLLFLLILLLSHASFCQSTFFTKTQGTNIFNLPHDFVVKPDNNILFLNNSQAVNSDVYDNNIFELSPEGQILNIVTYTDTSSKWVEYTHIMDVDDTLYVFGWGQKNLPGVDYPFLIMLKLNMQLDLIDSVEINIDTLNYETGLTNGQVKYLGENFLYVSSTGAGGTVRTCFLAEITKNGKMPLIVYDDESTCTQIPYDFLPKVNEEGFYIFTWNNDMPGYYYGGFMYDYDRVLNINSFSLLPNDFWVYFTTLPVDDSSFYLSGTWMQYSSPDIPPYRTGIMKMKTDGTALDEKLFYSIPGADTADNTAYRNSLDYLSDGNLILCSNHNITIQIIPQLVPSYIRLIKLTPDLDVVWERFIGNGDGKYDAYVMKTTPYDEIIIFGAWSPAPPTNWDYTEPMFIKTNGEGLFTSIPEGKAWIKSSDAILYPNPANDQVTVEFSMAYRSAEFQLTDISGKTLFTTHLSANRQTVDISALQAGTYLYRIFNQKGLEETGKLVVK